MLVVVGIEIIHWNLSTHYTGENTKSCDGTAYLSLPPT